MSAKRMYMSLLACLATTLVDCASKPNIVFLLSDDQDIRLGSMQYMDTLQRELVAKGTSFFNHHTTVAQCCPSRTTLLRGQAAHNTNITNVHAPGGNYEKFMLSGQGADYLPHWLKRAGYSTEYIGKFINGITLLNYETPPPGWDHVDYFIEPYQTTPNRVAMSENGETPVAYLGYHQSDVIRAKALARLEQLSAQGDPFMLFLSPTAPHVDDETFWTVPCARHMGLFPNVTAPRTPSFNPPDDIHNNTVSWVRQMPRLNKDNVTYSDLEFRNRAQALVGIDEILADVLAMLQQKGLMDNTYVIYSSDNGYHLGQHRLAAGKATPYVEDTNLPFVVRGPGIPEGVESKLPQLHLDLAPTFLDIAGVPEEEFPAFFDGRSLLEQWKNPNVTAPDRGQGASRDIVNIEYWGRGGTHIPGLTMHTQNSTYKSLRIVGDEFAYLYTQWCYTNELELYDTNVDPYEIHNLALKPNSTTSRLLTRLNALLLGQKSCSQGSCRDPWKGLFIGNATAGADITSLRQAMDPKYDQLFNGFPKVNIAECLGSQLAEVEGPFWPPASESLGRKWRDSTDSLGPAYNFPTLFGNEKPEGGPEQRHATLAEIEAKSRKMTKEELDPLQSRTILSSGRGYRPPYAGAAYFS